MHWKCFLNQIRLFYRTKLSEKFYSESNKGASVGRYVYLFTRRKIARWSRSLEMVHIIKFQKFTDRHFRRVFVLRKKFFSFSLKIVWHSILYFEIYTEYWNRLKKIENLFHVSNCQYLSFNLECLSYFRNLLLYLNDLFISVSLEIKLRKKLNVKLKFEMNAEHHS